MAPQDNTNIYIDGELINVTHRRLTGAQLCALVRPPADNIWLDVADAQDQPISLTATVKIERDMRFFTDRPRTIYIDKIAYTVRTATLTETQLRALPTPHVPDNHGIWKDIQDDLDDPIELGELVTIVDQDRFFTKPMPQRHINITVNRRQVTLDRPRQTGLAIKETALAQGVPIKLDFLLTRKAGAKFEPVGDNENIRVRENDEFRANDGDDNS
ncbi:multiubiquitin domain-containing protein [Nocardia salmonicida]|uniref:multiubiquitin domain-containing protein n=1 Tax=Nocardia salmonicida TaxID=53431 RepID=UPI0007A5406D|nr:multiubiquitin domain-containing protein [Nocardia salmonicida]